MNKTNWLHPAGNNPVRASQAEMSYTPMVKTFPPTPDTAALEADINAWLATLTAPLTEPKYYLRHIEYTSAQFANNTIHYSALAHYEDWEVV